jgi:two-component system OmpR family sensor kinase
MRKPHLSALTSMITTVSLGIGVGTAVIIYIWVVPIAGHEEESTSILAGGLLATLLALGVGVYFARLVATRVRRIEDAARKVADGDFTTEIPIDNSGQLGQLARTFNEMQRRLAELDNARSQFIANASHELRTPIFSLGGFVELLEEEDPGPEERAEFVRTMREQVDRLTKLTSDLLNLSQLDAGGVVLHPRAVDLSSLARDVVRELGARARRRGSQLKLRTPKRPVRAFADPDRVQEIIRILVDNALTHNPQGTSATVTTYAVNRRAELTVSDDGPGIPGPVRGRVFERFYTGDPSGGSGLGLAIARALAHRMGGGVRFSTSLHFTAFTLDLPPAPRGEPPAQANSAKATA